MTDDLDLNKVKAGKTEKSERYDLSKAVSSHEKKAEKKARHDLSKAVSRKADLEILRKLFVTKTGVLRAYNLKHGYPVEQTYSSKIEIPLTVLEIEKLLVKEKNKITEWIYGTSAGGTVPGSIKKVNDMPEPFDKIIHVKRDLRQLGAGSIPRLPETRPPSLMKERFIEMMHVAVGNHRINGGTFSVLGFTLQATSGNIYEVELYKTVSTKANNVVKEQPGAIICKYNRGSITGKKGKVVIEEHLPAVTNKVFLWFKRVKPVGKDWAVLPNFMTDDDAFSQIEGILKDVGIQEDATFCITSYKKPKEIFGCTEIRVSAI